MAAAGRGRCRAAGAVARRGSATYPARPVRIIVGFAPGGGNDIVARLIGQWLSERLGQPFVVENRPGAGGNIATEAVVHAPPDGYTLLVAGRPTRSMPRTTRSSTSISSATSRQLRASSGFRSVCWSYPSFPAKTIPELIAYAKANPGKVNMASAGSGRSRWPANCSR